MYTLSKSTKSAHRRRRPLSALSIIVMRPSSSSAFETCVTRGSTRERPLADQASEPGPPSSAARSDCHDLGYGELGHPALFSRALGLLLDEIGVRGQVGELQAPGLEPDHCACSTTRLQLFGQVLDTAPGQPRGLDAVEGRWVPSLLDMSENGRPGIEEIPALLLEHRGDETSGIDRVRVLAANNQAQALA